MKKLLVIGSMNMDFVTDLPHALAVGETILAQNLRLVPGGKGANQAYAMGKLGGTVTMLGAVGADLHGERLCGNLQSVGVEVEAIRKAEDSPTGMAVITVLPSGDNSILVLQGANAQVTPEYVKEHHQLLEECDILVLQLEIPPGNSGLCRSGSIPHGQAGHLGPCSRCCWTAGGATSVSVSPQAQ